MVEKRTLPPRTRKESAAKRRISEAAATAEPATPVSKPPTRATPNTAPAKTRGRASLAKATPSKRRASTLSQATPAPEPESEAEPEPEAEPEAEAEPAPKAPVLPTKLKDGQPLPHLPDPQATDLKDEEYQSVAESAVLLASFQRSQSKWVMDGLFERYWTKPSKKKGHPEVKNPANNTMARLGTCTILIPPHTFEAVLYTIKDPQAEKNAQHATPKLSKKAQAQQKAPMNTFHPYPAPNRPPYPIPAPNKAQPPLYAIPPAPPQLNAKQPPAPQQQQPQAQSQTLYQSHTSTPQVAPQVPTQIATPTPPYQSLPPPPPPPHTQVNPQPQSANGPPPPSGNVSVVMPARPGSIGNTSNQKNPIVPSGPPAPPLPQSQLTPNVALNTTSAQPGQIRPGLPPAAPRTPHNVGHPQAPPPPPVQASPVQRTPSGPPGPPGPPARPPAHPAQHPTNQPPRPPAKPMDSVIQMLANRAASDPALKALMRIVASSQANQQQLRAFQNHIDELNAIIAQREAARVKAEHAASLKQAGNAGLPGQPAASPAPPAGVKTGPVTPAPYGHPPLPAYQTPTHPKAGSPAPFYPKGPPKPAARPYVQSPAQQQPRPSAPLPSPAAPAPPPPPPKVEVKGVCIEFLTPVFTDQRSMKVSGDRYLLPRDSIVEFPPPKITAPGSVAAKNAMDSVLVSFLVIRSGATARALGPDDQPLLDKDKEYYQPLTMEIRTTAKALEVIGRAVKPKDEVVAYMEDVFDSKERVPVSYLHYRLPRADAFAEANDGAATESGTEQKKNALETPVGRKRGRPPGSALTGVKNPSAVTVTKIEDEESEEEELKDSYEMPSSLVPMAWIR